MPVAKPPLGSFQVPPFYELNWRDFQFFCRELLSRDDVVGSCQEYGKGGQLQHGIDLLKEFTAEQRIDLAQCKCMQSFDADDITDAVEAFWKHRTLWRERHASRFILMVACDVADLKVQTEYHRQKRRLRQAGFEFHLWGARQLEDKLRPHRDIAVTYCSPEWTERICRSSAASATASNIATGVNAVVSQLGDALVEIRDERIKQLERLTEVSRCHKFDEVLAELRAVKNAKTWSLLEPALRARILRFEATTIVNVTDDFTTAEALIAEGKKLHPEGDFQVADAYVKYRRQDRTEALRLLENPRSLNAFNLRLGLLLEIGEAGKVAAAVVPAEWTADHETHRYAAYAHLFLGEIENARHRIEQAMETGRKYPPVREAFAVVQYFSGISPAWRDAFRHLDWPIPVPWSFVKRGPGTDQRQRAAEIFASLIAEYPAAEGTHRWRRWRLACLATQIGQEHAAGAQARELLKHAPADVTATIWALERGYEFDRAAAETALLARIKVKPNVEECLAIASLRVLSDRLNEADVFLDEHRQTFEAAQQIEAWTTQKRLLKEGRAPRTPTKGETEDLLADYGRNPDPRVLFALCEAKLGDGDPAFVADRAGQLIAEIGTETALRLSLHGLFRAGRHAKCIETLETHRSLLPDGALSMDLIGIRIECRRKLGHISAAAKEADQAFAADPSFDRALHLFQVQLEAGDAFGAMDTARRALSIPGVPLGFFMEAARVIAAFDRQFAVQLWRHAVSDGFDAVINIPLAYETAISLGLDHEAAPLATRMMALAREGKRGVIGLTLADARRHLQDVSRATSDLLQKYSRGQLPAHILAGQSNVGLAQLYHSIPRQNAVAADPHRSFPVFFRSADRSVDERPLGPGPVHVDVSALLLAHELGILDLAEQAFGELWVAPHLTACLFKEIEHASRRQVSRRPLAEQLLRLQRENQLTVANVSSTQKVPENELMRLMGADWCSELRSAHENGGAIVDYLPLQSNDDELRPVELEGADRTKVWGAADVARFLHLTGHLSLPALEAALKIVGGTPSLKSDEQLRSVAGKPVRLLGNIWETLAEADLLAPLCRAAAVQVERAELESAAQFRESIEHESERVGILQALLARVRDGIANGRYKQLPVVAEPTKAALRAPAHQQLVDLIETGNTTSGLLWLDDRTLSRLRFCGKMAVVGSWEVLRTLRHRKCLTDLDYFAKLDWMRRANVRYIPVLAEEIAFQLGGASVFDGVVQETPALTTLRRYVASCLLDRERLLPPKFRGTTVQRIEDYTFGVELQTQLHDALVDLWRSDAISRDLQEARATWLWNNLYFDVAGFRQLMSPQGADPDVAENTVLSLSALFVRGMGLKTSRKNEDNPRRRYFEWLNTHVVERFLRANAPTQHALAAAIGGHIRRALRHYRSSKKSVDRLGIRILLQQFVMDLPDELVSGLTLTAREWHAIGITMHGPTVNVGPFSFDASAYWAASETAVNRGSSEITARRGDEPIQIERADESGTLLLRLIDAKQGKSYTVRDSANPLLIADTTKRLAYLTTNAHWFDCDLARRNEEITRIASLGSPADRIPAAQSWRDKSAEAFYRRLDRKIEQEKRFTTTDFPLYDWNSILRHLRVDHDGPLDLARSAAALLREEGLAVAMERMSCVPINLAPELVQAFRELQPGERDALLSRLSHSLQSPLQRIHLVHLLGEAAAQDESYLTRTQSELDRFFSHPQGATEFECFTAIVRMVRVALNRDGSPLRAVPDRSLLVNWYHASRLYAIVARHNKIEPSLADFLEGAGSEWSADLFARVPGYWEDIAHPQHLNRGCLILHGLDSVLQRWPEPIREKIKVHERVANEIGAATKTGRMLQIGLITDWSLYGNILGSFLGAGSIRAIVWNDAIEPVLAGDLNATIAAARRYIEAIVQGDNSRMAWVRLSSLLGDAPAPAALHEELVRLLRTVKLDAFREGDDAPHVGSVAQFVARRSRESNDGALINAVDQQILDLAEVCARENRLETARRLVDAQLSLSVLPNDSAGTARQFFERVQRLIRVCPPVVAHFKDSAGGWLADLPLEQQGALWPFLVHVRAFA